MENILNPNEGSQTPTENSSILVWGTSTIGFDVNAPENADKLNVLVEAGF